MSPKSKKLTGWTLCTSCACHFKLKEQHERQCKEMARIDSSESFNGSYLLLTPEISGDNTVSVNAQFKIHMNPDIMEQFNLAVYDVVEISDRFAATVLPNPNVRHGSFGVAPFVFKTYFKKDSLEKVSLLEPFDGDNTEYLSQVELYAEPELWVESKADFVNQFRNQFRGVYMRKGQNFTMYFLNGRIHMTVIDIKVKTRDGECVEFDAKRWFECTDSTGFSVDIDGCGEDESEEFLPHERTRFESLGGYGKQRQSLQELLDSSLKKNKAVGCLMYGLAGCGKSSFGHALGNSLADVKLKVINSYDILEGYYKDPVDGIMEVFKSTFKEQGKYLVFVDNLDHTSDDENKSQRPQLVQQVAKGLSYLIHEARVCMVLASARSRGSLAPDVLHYFDQFFEFKCPEVNERLEIFQKHNAWMNGALSADEIKSVTDTCFGFFARDLSLLSRQTFIQAKQRCKASALPCNITVEDLKAAYKVVISDCPDLKPDALISSPVHWEDICGYDDVKEALRKAFEWPIANVEMFEKLNLPTRKGVLLYGATGCSKTMMARAVATECKMNLIVVRGYELLSKYVGESERKVKELFARARAISPSIIFFDEIDAVSLSRDKKSFGDTDCVLSSLLAEMDGTGTMDGVNILAATNKPSRIDKALLRPKRLDTAIYIRLPCPGTRALILKRRIAEIGWFSADIDIDYLVRMTEGFCGDEVIKLCDSAAYECDDDEEVIQMKHFEIALREKKGPIIKPDSLLTFEEFEKTMSKSRED